MGTMQMSQKGIDWLKNVECLACRPYDDQTGRPIAAWVPGATIGYGHLIVAAEWSRYQGGMTEADAEALLSRDLGPFIRAVNAVVTANLSQNQFDALTIFAYNIGRDAFARSSVVKLVNNPRAVTAYPSIEQAWKAWNKSQGCAMAGLVKRRNAEWTMYATGRYASW